MGVNGLVGGEVCVCVSEGGNTLYFRVTDLGVVGMTPVLLTDSWLCRLYLRSPRVTVVTRWFGWFLSGRSPE